MHQLGAQSFRSAAAAWPAFNSFPFSCAAAGPIGPESLGPMQRELSREWSPPPPASGPQRVTQAEGTTPPLATGAAGWLDFGEGRAVKRSPAALPPPLVACLSSQELTGRAETDRPLDCSSLLSPHLPSAAIPARSQPPVAAGRDHSATATFTHTPTCAATSRAALTAFAPNSLRLHLSVAHFSRRPPR